MISRALAQIFSIAEIGRRLAFRGGTALYKLNLKPAARYSEDIDAAGALHQGERPCTALWRAMEA